MPIPREHILSMAAAGAAAPSAGNGQPCRFLAIEGHAAVKRVLDASADALFPPSGASPATGTAPADREVEARFRAWSTRFENAALLLVITADMESLHPEYAAHDCPLAAANIMLAAVALGYGSTYLTDTVNPEGVRRALGLGPRWKPVCTIAVGVPAEVPLAPDKKALDEVLWFGAPPA